MGDAPATAILWPAVAMAGLTFLVWVRLYQLRLGEMARKRIDAQQLANAADSVRLLVDTRASDNFRNLFELPVLFYAGVLLAAQIGVSDAGSIALAWAFVALSSPALIATSAQADDEQNGENTLVIHPDECIDCGVCIPECPADAIFGEDDVPPGQHDFIKLNAELAQAPGWRPIVRTVLPLPDADIWNGKANKREMLERKWPAGG